MSVFGQVWLYSIASFVLGVLFTWLLLVRPARARLRELERRVVAHRSELMGTQQVNPVADAPRADGAAVAGPYEPDGPVRTAGYLDIGPPGEATVTEETSVPGELGGAGEASGAAVAGPENDSSIGAALNPEVRASGEPGAAEHDDTARGLFQPAVSNEPPSDRPDPGPGPAAPAAPPGDTGEDGAVDPAPTSEAALPKRQRKESPPGGFDPPEPIQPSMRTVARRQPDQPGGHSGSLFEPGASGSGAVESVPERDPAEETHTEEAPVGPFGPGSAMPLPGGDRPSGEFTVKASVTTLRYCSQGAERYPEMVAEVWFRAPQDAERVGFRPID